jgi:hypothetical protein
VLLPCLLLPYLLLRPQRGIPYVRERGMLNVSLPNKWNFGWDHALFVQVGMLEYCLLF